MDKNARQPTQDCAPQIVAERIRSSFAKQRLMQTIGAQLTSIQSGEVEIALSFREDLTQQHGFLHAAVITAIADSAAGYAALTLMPPDVEVLSVEFKVNLLAPGVGEHFTAVGRVIRSGKTITVCSGEVFAHSNGLKKLICVLQGTMIKAST